MQTFLPLPEFEWSAHVLDRQRLGKQRVETLQILRAIFDGGAWANHPATLMWHGYENALVHYGLCICDEWIRRRYVDNCRDQIKSYWGRVESLLYPDWLSVICSSHRAALLAKLPEHYNQFGWIEQPVIEYYWPTKQ